jgi:hypothetical protein
MCNPYHVERRDKAGSLMSCMAFALSSHSCGEFEDSFADIAVARAAAIPVIAVDYGCTDIPVRDLNADRVIGAFTELPAAVNPLLGKPVGNIL